MADNRNWAVQGMSFTRDIFICVSVLGQTQLICCFSDQLVDLLFKTARKNLGNKTFFF